MIKLFKKYQRWRGRKAWEKHRSWLLFIASNGAHIPAEERMLYNLPDWTG